MRDLTDLDRQRKAIDAKLTTIHTTRAALSRQEEALLTERTAIVQAMQEAERDQQLLERLVMGVPA